MYILLEDCNFILLTFDLNFELHWPRVNFLFNLSSWPNCFYFVVMAELFLLCRHGQTVFSLSSWSNCFYFVVMAQLFLLCRHGRTVFTLSSLSNCFYFVVMAELFLLCRHGRTVFTTMCWRLFFQLGIYCNEQYNIK